MILHELTGTEDNEAYQQLEIANSMARLAFARRSPVMVGPRDRTDGVESALHARAGSRPGARREEHGMDRQPERCSRSEGRQARPLQNARRGNFKLRHYLLTEPDFRTRKMLYHQRPAPVEARDC